MKYFIYWIEHQDNFGFEEFDTREEADRFVAALRIGTTWRIIRGREYDAGER